MILKWVMTISGYKIKTGVIKMAKICIQDGKMLEDINNIFFFRMPLLNLRSIN